jgi:hypothetical protein
MRRNQANKLAWRDSLCLLPKQRKLYAVAGKKKPPIRPKKSRMAYRHPALNATIYSASERERQRHLYLPWSTNSMGYIP